MKCYVHHDLDAVGICSECEQGMCDVCAVGIGGKLYCKTDADRVFGGRKEAEDVGRKEAEDILIEKPVRTRLASIFFFLYGAFGAGAGILFISAGLASGSLSNLPFYDSVGGVPLELASLGSLGLGGLMLAMGVAGLVCGVWLWRIQIRGAKVGIPLLIAGMIIALSFLVIVPNLSMFEFFSTVCAINGSLMVLLVASWVWLRSLRRLIPGLESL